jgi:hypothetical protein
MTEALKVLVLDDLPARHDTLRNRHRQSSVTHCFCLQSAIWHVQRERFDVLQLDHDLEDYEQRWTCEDGHSELAYVERTGMDFAVWLAKNPPVVLPKIIIHSANPLGAQAMERVLRAAGFDVTKNPEEV